MARLGPCILALALGCAAEAEGDEASAPMGIALVEAPAWTMSDLASDPFADMRPPEVECDELRGTYVLTDPWGSTFEINTDWCNYVTIEQPLLEPLAVGDEVEIRVFHFELTGGPAEGYLALALDSRIMWEATVPIPRDSELVTGTFEVTEPLDAGTTVHFHVHNHGTNTWEIYSIKKL